MNSLVEVCLRNLPKKRKVSLVKKFADQFDTSLYGVTPLMMLCLGTEEPLEAIRVLLEKGADPNQGFLRACRNEDLPKMELLYRYGASLDLPDDTGMTPIHYTVDYPLALQWLVSRGAETQLRDKEGMMALDRATLEESIKILSKASTIE
jgi:ankyrin repeat protein